MHTYQVTNSSRNDGNTVLPAVKITQLNTKNANANEWSLGDVLLLAKHERDLKELGWAIDDIEALAPNFYCR
jgi:hypothetical protein